MAPLPPEVGPYVITIKQRPAEGRLLDKELEEQQEQVRAAAAAHVPHNRKHSGKHTTALPLPGCMQLRAAAQQHSTRHAAVIAAARAAYADPLRSQTAVQTMASTSLEEGQAAGGEYVSAFPNVGLVSRLDRAQQLTWLVCTQWRKRTDVCSLPCTLECAAASLAAAHSSSQFPSQPPPQPPPPRSCGRRALC